MASTTRHPAVAGRFYPAEPDVLLSDVQSYLSPCHDSIAALGCFVPHAGYIYSGSVAGAVFAQLQLPSRCIVLCPNHTGRGKALSIMSQGDWETPLGPARIDAELAECLKRQFRLLNEDSEAHRGEHAIEVELPFLQARRADFTFVPIVLGTSQFEILEALGLALATVVKAEPEPVLLIASSDMNHYENDRITRVKDHKAIARILELDAPG